MKKDILINLAVAVGATLFNLVYWKETMGLNTLILAVFLVAALWFLNKESFSERTVQIATGGTLITAMLLVYHNSLFVRFIHILSIPVLIGFVQARTLRFIGLAGFLYAANIVQVPLHLTQQLKKIPIVGRHKSIFTYLRVAFFALLILPIFYSIYYNANPSFAALADGFWTKVFEFLSFDWNFDRVIFFIFGLFLTGAALWKHTLTNPEKLEADCPDDLNPNDFTPKEINEGEEKSPIFNMSIDDRYRNGITLLVALNALILLNNILDFQHVWLGSALTRSPWELKQYVHEGTYLLIWGILLAIAVLTYLFWGALNFHPKAHLLRGLGIAWVAQNAFLALSVGCRNWQYIDHCGLAYKRIGVFIFLTLTLFGLYFMYLKIKEKRTFYFVIRRVFWAIYGILLACCFINGDVFITNYNIKTPVKTGIIDVRFLLEDVSPKNLSLLYEHQDTLKAHFDRITDGTKERMGSFDKAITTKKDYFLREQNTYSWLSWNYMDAKILQFLKEKNLVTDKQ